MSGYFAYIILVFFYSELGNPFLEIDLNYNFGSSMPKRWMRCGEGVPHGCHGGLFCTLL